VRPRTRDRHGRRRTPPDPARGRVRTRPRHPRRPARLGLRADGPAVGRRRRAADELVPLHRASGGGQGLGPARGQGRPVHAAVRGARDRPLRRPRRLTHARPGHRAGPHGDAPPDAPHPAGRLARAARARHEGRRRGQLPDDAVRASRAGQARPAARQRRHPVPLRSL
ncbi:MAG: hypothetical protein AVDCRST_MAG85-3771, partial [uncultured Solirubrobacteraceae bacterium]